MITYRNLGRNEQLGNQLWLMSGTIGRAHAAGERAAFPFWRYRAYFCVPDSLFPDRVGVEGHDLGMDYLKDLRNFADIEDVIRDYFKPHPDVWATPQFAVEATCDCQRLSLSCHRGWPPIDPRRPVPWKIRPARPRRPPPAADGWCRPPPRRRPG